MNHNPYMTITVDTEAEPEFSSFEDFLEFLEDEDRTGYTGEELQKLTLALGTSLGKSIAHQHVRNSLNSRGLHLMKRERVKEVRTYSTNPHDRWYGKGSCKTHGGSGHAQISGFAGSRG